MTLYELNDYRLVATSGCIDGAANYTTTGPWRAALADAETDLKVWAEGHPDDDVRIEEKSAFRTTP